MALKSNIVALSKLSGLEAQKAEIFATLGDLDQYDILDEDVLFAIYVPSNVLTAGTRADGTKFELIGTENNTAEARWQGKVGLVLKSGPQAFKYRNNGQPYEGSIPQKGDWVIVHCADGREIFLKDLASKDRDFVACRRIHWSLIGMRVKDPRTVR